MSLQTLDSKRSNSLVRSLATLVRLPIPTRANSASGLLLRPDRIPTKDLRAGCVSWAAHGIEDMEDNATRGNFSAHLSLFLTTLLPGREREGEGGRDRKREFKRAKDYSYLWVYRFRCLDCC